MKGAEIEARARDPPEITTGRNTCIEGRETETEIDGGGSVGKGG